MLSKITIVGAGITGSLLANYLSKRNFEINLFDHKSDPRLNSNHPEYGYNVAITETAIKAFNKVGLDKAILNECVSLVDVLIHHKNGRTESFTLPDNFSPKFAIQGDVLIKIILDASEASKKVRTHFHIKCKELNIDKMTSTFELENGLNLNYNSDRIFGADGPNSLIRKYVPEKTRHNFSQNYLPFGYKALHILPNADGSSVLSKNAIHIWTGSNSLIIAIPSKSGSFSCKFLLPFEGHNSFSSIKTKEEFASFVSANFAELSNLIPTLSTEYFNAPVFEILSTTCLPWVRGNNIALIGDSAHSTISFFGHAIHSSAQDLLTLDECLDEFLPDWEKVLLEYQNRRVEEADSITALAKLTFSEIAKLGRTATAS